MANLILIGFMGSGKSAVGLKLSKRLQMKYTDTDDLVEAVAGLSVADIFDEYGEAYFRRLESEAVRKVSLLEKHVISTGGGVVLRPSNMESLKRGGILFCLSATAEEIWARVRTQEHRPLLKEPDSLEEIREMLSARAPYYSATDYTIQTTGLSVEQVTNEIVEVFEYAIDLRRVG